MMTFASCCDGPWIHCVLESAEQILFDVKQFQVAHPTFHIAVIAGTRMRDLACTFARFQEAFRFPDYFGKNGNAFDECINDLEWLAASGYLLIVTHSQYMLSDSVNDRNWLIKTLNAAGGEWSSPIAGEWARPAIPFHVILQTEDAQFIAELLSMFPEIAPIGRC